MNTEEFLADIQRRLELTGAEAGRNKFTKADVQNLMNIIGGSDRMTKRELIRRLRMVERQRDLLLEFRELSVNLAKMTEEG